MERPPTDAGSPGQGDFGKVVTELKGVLADVRAKAELRSPRMLEEDVALRKTEQEQLQIRFRGQWTPSMRQPVDIRPLIRIPVESSRVEWLEELKARRAGRLNAAGKPLRAAGSGDTEVDDVEDAEAVDAQAAEALAEDVGAEDTDAVDAEAADMPTGFADSASVETCCEAGVDQFSEGSVDFQYEAMSQETAEVEDGVAALEGAQALLDPEPAAEEPIEEAAAADGVKTFEGTQVPREFKNRVTNRAHRLWLSGGGDEKSNYYAALEAERAILKLIEPRVAERAYFAWINGSTDGQRNFAEAQEVELEIFYGAEEDEAELAARLLPEQAA